MCVYVLTEVKKEVEEGDEPRAETESESEEELSCFAPTVMDTHRKPTLHCLHTVDFYEGVCSIRPTEEAAAVVWGAFFLGGWSSVVWCSKWLQGICFKYCHIPLAQL